MKLLNLILTSLPILLWCFVSSSLALVGGHLRGGGRRISSKAAAAVRTITENANKKIESQVVRQLKALDNEEFMSYLWPKLDEDDDASTI